MKIEIIVNHNIEHRHYICYNFEDAINTLYNLKCQQIKSRPTTSRCRKCVYENNCSNVDIDGSCKEYKYDPPDGGYYG